MNRRRKLPLPTLCLLAVLIFSAPAHAGTMEMGRNDPPPMPTQSRFAPVPAESSGRSPGVACNIAFNLITGILTIL